MRFSPKSSGFQERKAELILRLYMDPADQDYVAARWAHANGVFYVFYWCAAQACEKYMKAIILFAGRSATNQRHDLRKLFDEVCDIDPAPNQNLIHLPNTTALYKDLWEGKSYKSYIDHLRIYGSPDNRYGCFGTLVTAADLHILDALCCAFRSLLRGHDPRIKGAATSLPSGEPVWHFDASLLLERLAREDFQVGENERLRKQFTNLNFSFFESPDPSDFGFGGAHSHGSPLYSNLYISSEIHPTTENKKIVSELKAWAHKNIPVNKSVWEEFDRVATLIPPR